MVSNIPRVHFGVVKPIRWQDADPGPDDDELLAVTDPAVVAMLGFDPLDYVEKKMATKGWTAEQKIAIWKTFDGKAREGEKAFINAVQSESEKQRAAMKKEVGDGIDAEAALAKVFGKEANASMKRALSPAWLLSFRRGYDIASASLSKGYGTKKDVRTTWEVVNPLLRSWIDTNGLMRAEGINDTTMDALRKKIAASLAEGMESGEGRGELSNRILDATDDVYDDMDRHRANLIARTETCATVNFGQLTTYSAEGVTKKEWMAAMDDRTREDHVDADGQIKDMEDMFEIGTDEMLAPGLGSDASQNCNCRCTILPVLDLEE